MTTLYELSTEMQELENALLDGDLTPEKEDELRMLMAKTEIDFNDKVIATVKVLKNMENDVDIIDAEIKRLTARKKSIQSKVDWLKGGIKASMENNEIFKVKSPLFTVSLSDLVDGSVVIDCPIENLPEEYIKTKTTVEVDKSALKDDLKAGVYIEGCYIEQVRKFTIR